MRGEIDAARRRERIGEVMPADGLQGVADGALGMAVIDDQGGAAEAHHAPADLKGDGVGAPLENVADLRCAQARAAAACRTAGSGRGAVPNANLPSAPISTTRSCQPSAHMTA